MVLDLFENVVYIFQKMLKIKMDVNCSFVKISEKIASTNKSWGIFRICMRRAVRKCPTFQQSEFGELKNDKKQSEYNIVGHPVLNHSNMCIKRASTWY